MRFEARVTKGHQIGKPFGIATANLAVEKALLPFGVYLVKVWIPEGKNPLWGLLHFGPRKTFGGEFSAEVHLLDFEGDLYQKLLKVEVVQFLRNIKTFPNADALFTQIEQDILKARKIILRKTLALTWEKAFFAPASIERALKEFLELFEKRSIRRLFCYAPTKKEIPFLSLLPKMLPPKTTYFFPRISGEHLTFHAVSDFSTLTAGDFGILAPSATDPMGTPGAQDIMLVPALAVDKQKHRLGKGGGYYDRYLSTHPEVFTCVLIPDFAVFEDLPTQPHDQKINKYIVVESKGAP